MSTPDLLSTPATSAGAFIGQRPILTPGTLLDSVSPIDGQLIATAQTATADDLPALLTASEQAFSKWRVTPAPKRGDLLHRMAQALVHHKNDLASLITLEVGKTLAESSGEVQQMARTFEFASGLSRQLSGITLPSQTPHQRIMEQYHPLGPVGIITSFNFPGAAFAASAAMAILAGNSVVWKPSEKASLSAVAIHHLLAQAAHEFGAPDGLLVLVRGRGGLGQALAQSNHLPLVCATGSIQMGRFVASAVGQRLGRSILELGGNNAAIVTPSADLSQAMDAILQSATATAGQRCTTLRRLIVHGSVYQKVFDDLYARYAMLEIGDPRLESTHIGPLIDKQALAAFDHALEVAQEQGGKVYHGSHYTSDSDLFPRGGCYVRPAIVEIEPSARIVQAETFAPILFLMRCDALDEAIAINNAVPQGLSSTLFSHDLREVEQFLSAAGSDCGQAHINAPTVGIELGVAFGGEKLTGGGREFSPDAWKMFSRRQTSAIAARSVDVRTF